MPLAANPNPGGYAVTCVQAFSVVIFLLLTGVDTPAKLRA